MNNPFNQLEIYEYYKYITYVSMYNCSDVYDGQLDLKMKICNSCGQYISCFLPNKLQNELKCKCYYQNN